MKYPKNEQQQFKKHLKLQLELEHKTQKNVQIVSVNFEFEKLKQLILNKLNI